MPGKGEFKLTGQLGDVMKESAQAGISYIRSVSEKFDIPKEFFKENDIHIHIPEGAVPKTDHLRELRWQLQCYLRSQRRKCGQMWQ